MFHYISGIISFNYFTRLKERDIIPNINSRKQTIKEDNKTPQHQTAIKWKSELKTQLVPKAWNFGLFVYIICRERGSKDDFLN